MDGSVPNLRLQMTGLFEGTINLRQFQRWVASAEPALELRGSDADLDLLNRVLHLLAEYTSGYIDDATLLNQLVALANGDHRSQRALPSVA
jgi:hypothetical protein